MKYNKRNMGINGVKTGKPEKGRSDHVKNR